MKKITSAILALLLAASMTACGEKAVDTMEEVTAQTTAAETEKATEAVTTEDKQEETEAEAAAEETTETTEAEPEKSEKDILFEDIVKAVAESKDGMGQWFCYLDDGKLIYNGEYEGKNGSVIIDTKNYTASRVTYDNYDEWYTYYDNGNIYSIAGPYFRTIDSSGNTIAALMDNDKPVVNSYMLEDGNLLLCVYDEHDEERTWGVYSPKLELIKEVPKLEVDAGHGETKELDIYDIGKIYQKKAYINYGSEAYKIVDLDTMEMTDPTPEEDPSSSRLFSTMYAYFGHKIAGKYSYYGSDIYDIENNVWYGGILDWRNFFVTEKAFYYVEDHKLYRYISEDEGELVYDGSTSKSNYAAVSEDNFVVYDEIGTFLVDMATGEEHRIELI